MVSFFFAFVLACYAGSKCDASEVYYIMPPAVMWH